MSRRLIIEGNAIYEIDEECMLKKKLEDKKEESRKLTEINQTSEEAK